MDISAVIEQLRRLPPQAAVAREAAAVAFDTLDGSLAIAGTPLDATDLRAVLERGVALGGHPIGAYLAAQAYANAARFVAERGARRAGDRQALLTIDDFRHLHALAVGERPSERPGGWRLGVAESQHIVSPAPWLVPFEAATLMERIRREPAPDALPRWLAGLLARIVRLRAFEGANGRVARLTIALLTRRLDVPPAAILRADATTYHAALDAALAGSPQRLERLIAGSMRAAGLRLLAAADPRGVLPLRDAAGTAYESLVKAAQRGRLAAFRRGGRWYTTAVWLAAYRG